MHLNITLNRLVMPMLAMLMVGFVAPMVRADDATVKAEIQAVLDNHAKLMEKKDLTGFKSLFTNSYKEMVRALLPDRALLPRRGSAR